MSSVSPGTAGIASERWTSTPRQDVRLTGWLVSVTTTRRTPVATRPVMAAPPTGSAPYRRVRGPTATNPPPPSVR
ncbi:MAG: hypothetical protein J4F45_09900 [Pseudomonadales bacterium]|nr:hypothetical protein [Pseudomonadales bacterium]